MVEYRSLKMKIKNFIQIVSQFVKVPESNQKKPLVSTA
jgi:hypothetical protein